MALEPTGEQRSKVISLIKRHISEQGNCRVGWALRQVAGEKFENSIHLKEKIANTMIQSGKYIKEESAQPEKDWNILVNPQYKMTQLQKWAVIISLILGIIGTAAAVIWKR